MEDYQIVDLYWQRSESAISESDKKYGRMLFSISQNLVSVREDAEECLNDTYVAAWNSMPDERPVYLGAFLSKIIRRLSIDKYRASHSKKRGGAGAILEELSDAIPSGESVESEFENARLGEAITSFLSELDEEKRYVFIRRYYYSDDLRQIAKNTGSTTARIKSILHRLRGELQKYLSGEGLFV